MFSQKGFEYIQEVSYIVPHMKTVLLLLAVVNAGLSFSGNFKKVLYVYHSITIEKNQVN